MSFKTVQSYGITVFLTYSKTVFVVEIIKLLPEININDTNQDIRIKNSPMNCGKSKFHIIVS